MPQPKILLLTSELFPEFGVPTAGGGVRAQQLFRSLQADGFGVDLAIHRDTAEKIQLPEWATRFLYRPEFLDGIIEQADPDVVLSEGWEPLSHLKHSDNRIYISDCPGPLMLENQLRGVGDLRSNVHHKIRTFSRLDAVLIPTKLMRAYLVPFATLAGWTPDDSDRFVHAPISLPEDVPHRDPTSGGEFTIFAGGVAWAWHRSAEWLKKLSAELDQIGSGQILAQTGKHPHHRLNGEGVYEDLSKELAEYPRITVRTLSNWDELIRNLAGVQLSLDWSPRHFERELASTLRTVTCLWSGVPVIVRPHLEIASEIESYGAGWVTDDWRELIDIVRKVIGNRDEIEERSRNAQKLARERHSWPRAHEELFRKLREITPRSKQPSFLQHADSVFREQEAEIVRLRNERELLGEELARLSKTAEENVQDADAFRNLRQKLPYRIWKRIFG